ncbi:unnamed protein product [Lampetra planeri]
MEFAAQLGEHSLVHLLGCVEECGRERPASTVPCKPSRPRGGGPAARLDGTREEALFVVFVFFLFALRSRPLRPPSRARSLSGRACGRLSRSPSLSPPPPPPPLAPTTTHPLGVPSSFLPLLPLSLAALARAPGRQRERDW